MFKQYLFPAVLSIPKVTSGNGYVPEKKFFGSEFAQYPSQLEQ